MESREISGNSTRDPLEGADRSVIPGSSRRPFVGKIPWRQTKMRHSTRLESFEMASSSTGSSPLAHEQTQLGLKDHEVSKHREKRPALAPVAPVSFLLPEKGHPYPEFGLRPAWEPPLPLSDRVFGVNGFRIWSIRRGKHDEVCPGYNRPRGFLC